MLLQDDVPTQSQVQTEQPVTNEVEPFSLDQDFDYDNVVLTPKYTEAEMSIVKDLMEMFPKQ